jgi:hypothetical protein
MTAHDFLELDGMPPEEAVHNHMANISAHAQFNWYEYIWYIVLGIVSTMGSFRERTTDGRSKLDASRR